MPLSPEKKCRQQRRRREGTKARPRIFISLFFCRPGGGVKCLGHPDINIHHHQHKQSVSGVRSGCRECSPITSQDPSYLLRDQFGIVKLEYKMVLPSRICSAGEPSFKRSWHSLLFHLGCDAGRRRRIATTQQQVTAVKLVPI